MFLRKLERYSKLFPCRIYTRYINPAGSLFRRVLKQKSCAPGTADCDLLLRPHPGDLIFDKIASYGLTPSHIRKLKAHGIERATICGLDTDACVLGVMFSLFDAGIECHLKEDMCWSSSGLHKPALAIIREQFPESR
jgi:nicotinamidase-related amidase